MADRALFTPTVQARLRVWRQIAYLLCGDWTRAEDLLQQALLKMYTHWHRIDLTNIDGYARTVITRLAIDESRRAHRSWERGGEVPETAAAAPDLDDAIVVRDALQKVPPRQRAVLVWRFYQGLSVSETAQAMGTSEGNVKSQTSRGLAALRSHLGTLDLPMEGVVDESPKRGVFGLWRKENAR